MNYLLATDNQLETILFHDNAIPTHLLSGVVEEVLNRGILDKFIADAVYSVIGRKQKSKRYDFEDLMQMGRKELFIAAKKYVPGKGKKFTSFAYTVIRQEIMRAFHYWTMQKRDDSDQLYYDAFDANWEVVDYRTKVEQYVVNKLFFQQMLELPQLSEIQRKVLLLRFKGMSLEKIAKIAGVKDRKCVSQIYYRGIEKIRRVGA